VTKKELAQVGERKVAARGHHRRERRGRVKAAVVGLSDGCAVDCVTGDPVVVANGTKGRVTPVGIEAARGVVRIVGTRLIGIHAVGVAGLLVTRDLAGTETPGTVP
jgi:hypothetical protein